jgi:hypothetical protein
MLYGRECDIEPLRIRFATADLLQNPTANWRTIARKIIHNAGCDPVPPEGAPAPTHPHEKGRKS